MKYIMVIITLILLISTVSAVDPPQITQLYPSSSYNVGVITIDIHGTNFDDNSVVYLTKCGSGMVIGTITHRTSTLITADFNIKGRTPGTATLRIYNNDGQIGTFPFIILGDAVTATPTLTTTYSTIYTTETPGYSTTTAEPDEIITYIYNIPTTTQLVPLKYRDYVTPIITEPMKIITVDTTIRPPTLQKIIPTKTPKSSINNVIIVPIIILALLIYIIMKREQ
jgi:hypothetical protein